MLVFDGRVDVEAKSSVDAGAPNVGPSCYDVNFVDQERMGLTEATGQAAGTEE